MFTRCRVVVVGLLGVLLLVGGCGSGGNPEGGGNAGDSGRAVGTNIPGCVQYPLIDTQPSPAPGQPRGPIQPECQVIDRIACATPGNPPNCLPSGYIENPLPECKDPLSGLPFDPATVTPTSPQLDSVPDSARPCWYLYYDPDPVVGCPDAYHNQRITALRPAGTQAPTGTVLAMKCLTCARADQTCPPLYP